MEEFLNDHSGWRRFPLSEDSVLRRVARERGLPVFDASRTGYPPRMRRGPGPAT